MSSVLPEGNPAAWRRWDIEEALRPLISSSSSALTTSAGSQRWDLAVLSSSGAAVGVSLLSDFVSPTVQQKCQ